MIFVFRAVPDDRKSLEIPRDDRGLARSPDRYRRPSRSRSRERRRGQRSRSRDRRRRRSPERRRSNDKEIVKKELIEEDGAPASEATPGAAAAGT